MAKRRTRKEKSEARHAYIPSYSLTMSDGTAQGSLKAGTLTAAYSDRMALTVDTNLIKKDIWKSVIISGIILAIELGIYFYKV